MGGIVQASALAKLGRFGNQMFQYACARGYARKVGATLETHDWIGRKIFKDIDEPIIKNGLTPIPMEVVPQDGQTDVALYGYFQHSQAFDLYTHEDLRQWFQFQDWVLEEMKDYISVPLAAHLRRGDYASLYLSSFAVIGEKAYVDAMAAHGYDSFTVTWVSEDKPRVYKRPGLEWLIDFWTLYNADVVFRANSTFSWWASALSGKKVYSPVVEGKRGIRDDISFIEGNWPRCTDQPNVHNYHIK